MSSVEPRCCEDITGIAAPEIGPKSFRTFEKQAPEKFIGQIALSFDVFFFHFH